jgi:hypothetical protein
MVRDTIFPHSRSGDTIFAQQKVVYTAGIMETTDSEDTPEKNIEVSDGPGEVECGIRGVKENEAPADEAQQPGPSGGLKAWLFVLATFLLFISAW